MRHSLLTNPSLDAAGAVGTSLRLQTIVRLRWIAVVGQLVAVGVVALYLKFQMPVGYCLATIALLAWLNVYLTIFFPARLRISSQFATMMLAFDIFQLMLLLYLTGGIQNPFIFLIVAPVTVSAATLPLRNTILLGLLAMVAVSLLIYDYWPLPWFPGIRHEMPFLYKVGILAATGSSMTFLALYAWRLATETRGMFAAMAAAELVLAREQRLHALDGLAAAAAHELGTPLSTIILVTKEMARELSESDEHLEDLRLLQSQAERCKEILRKLTTKPSEQDDPMHAMMGVRELLDEAATPYRAHGKIISINVQARPAKNEAPLPEPQGIRQPGVVFGLGNIIENAVEFSKSRVDISAWWDSERVYIEISDDGPGFSQAVIDTLGEPFTTTREAGSQRAEGDTTGLGLGFFIAKTMLERSGACFEFDNKASPDHGAVIRIWWTQMSFKIRNT